MNTTKPPDSPGVASIEESGPTADLIVPALERIDPFLRFLTKATGKTMVPLQMLQSVLPKISADGSAAAIGAGVESDSKQDASNIQHEILTELTCRGVLHFEFDKQTVGFPLPPSSNNSGTVSQASSILPKPPARMVGKGLHGSTEAVAKRRMKVLLWTLEKESGWICRMNQTEDTGTSEGKKEGNRMKKRKASPKKKKSDKSVASETKQCTTASVSATRLQDVEQNSEHENDDTSGIIDCSKCNESHLNVDEDETVDGTGDRALAYQALHDLFSRNSNQTDNTSTHTNSVQASHSNTEIEAQKKNQSHWLPCQAAFAGSQPGRESRYGILSNETLKKIPVEALQLFNLDINQQLLANGNNKRNSIDSYLSKNNRKLFLHQARAIEAAMNGVHTVVCTSTGSGKSMCFLLPVIAKALSSLQQTTDDRDKASASILIFPTKALAQDQLTKINAMLKSLPPQPDESKQLRAGVIDGDTPHPQRDTIASECQIILTNPDTLHAAILPNWKRPSYKSLLGRVSTVVVDEAHVYEGAFGAHVALVLARLRRVCRVASSGCIQHTSLPLFIACSATMTYPEEHFRVLCPVTEEESVCVLAGDEDGSPCSPKHFFVWNAPILDINGNSTESVFIPKKSKNLIDADNKANCSVSDNDKEDAGISDKSPHRSKRRRRKRTDSTTSQLNQDLAFSTEHNDTTANNKFSRRRHAADETAFLLAKAITSGIRCIAFCKTRCLVEWVYEATISQLRSSEKTSHLVSRIESYRGGYSADARRSIEERFFRGDLWGVVGTNALELGVDVGNIHLTLHCGYPGSKSSLLQQAGRSGRGTGMPSCSVVVSFSSPSEQALWKAPTNVLKTGVDVRPSLPISGRVLQGHLLCAGEEFPLTDDRPVSCLLNETAGDGSFCPPDKALFGDEAYQDGVEQLIQKSLMRNKVVCAVNSTTDAQVVEEIICRETHPVMRCAWKRVNLRSIEPLNYVIIDINHPLQDGRTDKLVDKQAILDTIPYSRVFYHAFPGAIITHRGTRYKIESMESPPPFLGGGSFDRSKATDLCAFARPYQANYTTQALSVSEFNVVKQTDIVESRNSEDQSSNHSTSQTLAGRGTVNVKRSVHGYKKLSLVHRKEISRTSIVLPSMEFDTHGLWIDADACNIRDVVPNFDAGVHALSHAMVAVAPIFTSCANSDIDCDHSRFECTRILLYDKRAGGSGATHQLFDHLIDMLEASVDLLEDCISCSLEAKYDGGCPGCIQSVSCDNFQEDLNRAAALSIGKYLLQRLQDGTMNRTSSKNINRSGTGKAKEVLIGRPSWTENRDDFAEVDE